MHGMTDTTLPHSAQAATVLLTLVELLPARLGAAEHLHAHDFERLTCGLRVSPEAHMRAWEAVRCVALGSPRPDVPTTWLEDWLFLHTRSTVLASLREAAEALADRPRVDGSPVTVKAALGHLVATLPARFPARPTFATDELEWVLREAGAPQPTVLSTFATLGRHLRQRQLARGLWAWLACTSREEVVAELARVASG